jgi:hypothetical protein
LLGEAVPHRLLVLMLAALALSATTAGASSTSIPVIARGQTLHIKFTTTSYATCVAIVSYAQGIQLGTPKKATDGRLSWAFPVARSRPLGPGSWYVRCGLPIERTGKFIVVNAPGAAG